MVRQRAVELDTDRQDVRKRGRSRHADGPSISPRTISLRLDSAVRKTIRNSACRTSVSISPGPGLAPLQPAIDEDRIARCFEAGDDLCRESLVRLDVTFGN